MGSYSAYSYSQSASPSRVGQFLVALTGGLAIAAALLAAIPFAFGAYYEGKIFPGVSVAGVDLSGLTPEEAAARLAERLDYPTRGQIVFTEGGSIWAARPADLGLLLDANASAQAAFHVGRQGALTESWGVQYDAWGRGVDLPPLFVFDEISARRYLEGIAAQVDRPVIEASLGVNGVEVVVRSGQVGRALDVAAALAALRAHFPTLTDGIIPLTVRESPPVILDATEQAEIARKILSAPLVITVPEAEPGDPGPWTIEPATLAAMLTIERIESPQGARYQVGLSAAALRDFLNGLAPAFVRAPASPRFIFNDDTRQLEVIQPAVIGRSLDVETSLALISEKTIAGEHTVGLDMEYTNPPVTDESTGEQLGITQLVWAETSHFRGSSSARMQNIATAAARFHGVLVPPGASFSMAEVLGDVSLDSGYAEALIIFGDRTIKGVGGGVCQVSTTLFRAAFFAGFQIDERYAHAYRVGYYEQTASGYNPSLAGLDATVFAPVVDFRFTNDTPLWLLMETYVDTSRQTLTWKFYSTADGRSVEWRSSGPENRVEPPDPLYEENADLAQGEIVQVDWEAEGADVTVTRVVTLNGAVIHNDTIFTHYLPWRSVYQYGPGTEGIPTPEPTETP